MNALVEHAQFSFAWVAVFSLAHTIPLSLFFKLLCPLSISQKNVERFLEIITICAKSVDHKASWEAHCTKLQAISKGTVDFGKNKPFSRLQRHLVELCWLASAVTQALPSEKEGGPREGHTFPLSELQGWLLLLLVHQSVACY